MIRRAVQIGLNLSPVPFGSHKVLDSLLHSFSTTRQQQQDGTEFQSLLLQGSDDSLTQAARILGTLQAQDQSQQHELRELNERISFFPRHLIGLLQKEQKLIENIQLQAEDNQLIDKRVEKELQDSKDYGVSKVAKQVLEVADFLKKMDKLAKELKQKQSSVDVAKFQAVTKRLYDLFEKYGIEEFDPLNKPYDPNTQETVYEIPCPQGHTSNTVAETMRTGFRIKGRLLRSARVGIFT